MARKEANLKSCMIVNQFDHSLYNGWSTTDFQYLDMARGGESTPLLNMLLTRLANGGVVAEEAHIIAHDKDVRTVWDDVNLKYVDEPKPIHFHCVIKFTKGTPATISNISSILGIEPQNIEKPQRGRYSYENMLSYLIHIKYPDKHLYDHNEVVSLTNLSCKGAKLYKTYYNELKDTWEKGKASVKKAKAKENIDDLVEKILTGKVTKSEVVLTDEYYETYSRYTRRCEDAFMVYGERRAYKTLKALENSEFQLSVFYIVGESGSGKTRATKMLIEQIIEWSKTAMDEPFRFCQTAASNPMDDYNGEEILFMDDVRGASMTASDWLKLLDPYNSSPASARYKNKQPACRVIIITSTKEPIEFFYYCKQMGGGSRSEALDQFMRRIQLLTRVFRADDFDDTVLKIESGGFGDTGRYIVPNSNGETVELSYHFGEDVKLLPVGEAVKEMTNVVAKNNKKIPLLKVKRDD